MTSRVFSAYGPPIDIVTSFEYLGRVILAVQDDWLAVIQKLAKAWMVWRRMSSILSGEGERPWVSRFFFKAVIQSVFIFGAETWVVTPPVWDGSWRVSNTRWHGNLWGRFHGRSWTEGGSKPQRRWR